jgi:L-asparaginase
MKKKILILATGGTIASSDKGQGLAPTYNVEDLLTFVPRVRKLCDIDGKMVMNIDSSNMTPNCWVKIAKAVFEAYNDYDGFVITHGTDTMAYTSAALTYMLEGLNKPVVITGSQYPIAQEHTDAILNLNDAIHFACENIRGVFVVFDGKLISGPRAMKVKTRSYDAFVSVNFPYIAEIKHDRIQYKKFVIDKFRSINSNTDLILHPEIDTSVIVIKLFPGMDPKIFDYIKNNYSGIIIESFGIGGIPFENVDIASEVGEMVRDGMAVVMTTQCLEEGVDFDVYEVGKKIPKDGLIYANDMNTEATLAKLMCAIGRFNSVSDVKKMIESHIQYDMHYDEYF